MGQSWLKCEAEDLLKNGILFEINRQVLHPQGYALAVKSDDEGNKTSEFVLFQVPDGIIFDDDVYEEGVRKYAEYMEQEGNGKELARRAEFGFDVQDRVVPECENAMPASGKTDVWVQVTDEEEEEIKKQCDEKQKGYVEPWDKNK